MASRKKREEVIITELEMPRNLKSVDVSRDHFDDIAKNCLKDPWCKTNPVPMTETAQVLHILEAVAGSE